MDLGLRQEDVAEVLGVSKASIQHWEGGVHEPEVRFIQAVIRFLGYDPRPEAFTLGERIQRKRQGEGLSQRALAEKLGTDQATIWAWETGLVTRPSKRLSRIFEAYVEDL